MGQSMASINFYAAHLFILAMVMVQAFGNFPSGLEGGARRLLTFIFQIAATCTVFTIMYGLDHLLDATCTSDSMAVALAYMIDQTVVPASVSVMQGATAFPDLATTPQGTPWNIGFEQS